MFDWLILTKLADEAVKLAMAIDKRKGERLDRTADYFGHLGATLESMAKHFREDKIPRTDGSRFNVLLEGFNDSTADLVADLPAARYRILQQLKKLAQNAKRIDWHLLSYDPDVAKRKDYWTAELERAAGAFQGMAITLRTSRR